MEKTGRKVIGLTGGVGAGKSRITEILRTSYGAMILEADVVAHELMEPGGGGYLAAAAAFGSDILKEDGSIDRPKLSKLIFSDRAELEKMNRLIHPMVWKTIEEKISASQSGIIVVESAIVDPWMKKICDEIWYVYTSEANRLERLLRNRGYTKEHALSIMSNQASEKEYTDFSDLVIDNNGPIDEIKAQLAAILEE